MPLDGEPNMYAGPPHELPHLLLTSNLSFNSEPLLCPAIIHSLPVRALHILEKRGAM